MARYISREQLLERIASQKCEVRETVCNECDIKSFCVYGVVEHFPTADVARVRHGEWLDFYGDYSNAECSQCGYLVNIESSSGDTKKEFNGFRKIGHYCPNCGARMDGGANNG